MYHSSLHWAKSTVIFRWLEGFHFILLGLSEAWIHHNCMKSAMDFPPTPSFVCGFCKACLMFVEYIYNNVNTQILWTHKISSSSSYHNVHIYIYIYTTVLSPKLKHSDWMDPISPKKDWTPKRPATFFERSRAPVLLVACCQPPMQRAQDWSLLHRRKGMESGSPKRCRDVHVGTWDGDGIHLAWCQALFWFRLGWSGVKQPRGTGVAYVGGTGVAPTLWQFSSKSVALNPLKLTPLSVVL